MRLYKISMTGDFGDADSAAIWTAQKSMIPSLRRRLQERCSDAQGRPMPSVEVVEFHTTRADIVDMLNRFAARG